MNLPVMETKPKAATKPEASFFTMKTPALSGGRINNYMAETDLLSVSVKIYAEGGENGMHAHPHEDHSFIVLHGQATFHIGTEDNIRVVNPNEGVLLPKGVFYRFLSSAKENLVMLRIGAQTEKPQDWRIKPNGQSFVPDTPEKKKENGYIPPVVVPGKFYFE